MGDIEKSFLLVHMNETDKDVLRFLWVDDIDKAEPKVITLRFTRVMFGLSSSPFLLNVTLKHHIEQYGQGDPDFTGKFLESINVDGLTSGDSEIEIALQAKRQEDLEADDLEILWLEVCPYKSSRPLFIGGVYRPPSFRVADEKRLRGKTLGTYIFSTRRPFYWEISTSISYAP